MYKINIRTYIYKIYIYVKKIQMNTISESFDRAFRDKSVSNNQRAVNDSDSDSAKEQEKVIVEKRQKKRRRTTNRSKVAKNKQVV